MTIQPRPYIKPTLILPNNLWFNGNIQKRIDLNKIEDCYFLVYKAIINNISAEKAKEYEALLKINQEDYKTTVLQIELGKVNGY